MQASFFSAFFKTLIPPPRSLLLSGAGLEISEHSVKYLALERSGSEYTVSLYGSETVAPGVIADGEIRDPEALVKVLRGVRTKMGTRFVSVSLPEQKGYLFQARLADSLGLNLRESIEFTLEEHVPLAPGEAVFDYDVLSRQGSDIVLNVTAFPRKTVEGYSAVLRTAGFLPLSFEMESQAVVRTIIAPGDMKTRMVVDFGETRTAVSIIDAGIVRFTTSLEIAGASLMSALQKTLKVDEAEAERLKNDRGLLPGKTGESVAEILMPTVSALKDELNRHFIYWHTHLEQSEDVHHPIEEIVLCGGNANLRGLSEYLEQGLRTPVRIPNVWMNVCDLSSSVPPIPKNESIRFTTVLGLALRGHMHT